MYIGILIQLNILWLKVSKSPLIVCSLFIELTVIIMDNNNNRDITIAEGSNVMLRCEATGNVTMNYQWRRESKLFPKMNVMGRNTQNLTIYNIKVQNSGKYYCEADIGAKTIRSASVQVTARSKSSIAIRTI